jgi:hypothetical protein
MAPFAAMPVNVLVLTLSLAPESGEDEDEEEAPPPPQPVAISEVAIATDKANFLNSIFDSRLSGQALLMY